MTYLRYFKNDDLNDKLELPFKLLFNFRKVITWWEQKAASNDPSEVATATKVLERIAGKPELRHPIPEFADLAKCQAEIEILLEPFFPPILTTFDFKTAGIAFKPWFFNKTKRFEALLDAAGGDVRVPIRDKKMLYIFGGLSILNAYYRVALPFFHDLHFDFYDKQTGVPRRFLSKINTEFTEIIPEGEPNKLSPEDIKELIENFSDVELWKRKIPPESFRLEGFTIVSLFDVTRSESISALKYDLLNKNAFLDPDTLTRIEKNLCQLLNLKTVRAGFMLYNSWRELIQPIGQLISGSNATVAKRRFKPTEIFSDKAIETLFQNHEAYILSDKAAPGKNEAVFHQRIHAKGFQSYLAYPLFYDNTMVGILELGTDQPFLLNGMSVFTLGEITLLLTNAMKRLQDEQQNEIQAIIRQKCTAIHPTVAWRFNEAAEKLLEGSRGELRRRPGIQVSTEMEEISFNEVYPLYGQADIKDSSVTRNNAIQADLIEQLSLIKAVLDKAAGAFPLPVYKDLQYRAEKNIEQLKQQLYAGDENRIQEFFREHIDPVFNFFKSQGGNMKQAVIEYEQKLDVDTGMIYDERKKYELAVKQINDAISLYVDKAQQSAQEMFPHYLEKYKTDGVEHNLYIGQSMVENQVYHPLYLQNLRLWQLLVTCEIENEVNNIPIETRDGLRICSLILVHSNPVSIRFRMDEKKFDVDGAYNIRYELLKKRIDKAKVKTGNERLTQPGKLAIVYSQDKEAKEYVNYLRYLQSIEYIAPDIEWLELKDLQGLTGLKAIRADIIYNPKFEGIAQSKALSVVMN